MKKKLAKEWSQVSEKETSQRMESSEWKKKLAKERSQVSEKETSQRMESSEWKRN